MRITFKQITKYTRTNCIFLRPRLATSNSCVVAMEEMDVTVRYFSLFAMFTYVFTSAVLFEISIKYQANY